MVTAVTRGLRAASLCAVLALGLVGCAGGEESVTLTPAPTAPTGAPAQPHRVGVSGTSLTLDGAPWWPIGMNAYQLGTDWSVNEGCGAQVDLDDYFAKLPERTLTRIDVFASLAVNKTTGQLDLAPLDAVFDAAQRHNQLVVGVLTGDEGACEHSHFKDYDWYAGGWKTDTSHDEPMPFSRWLDIAVGRWGQLPVLAGWTIVGEAEPSICGSADCDWRKRICPPDATRVLRSFFDEAGARIRALDPDSLIWGGRASGGQCGSAGVDWAQVGASPAVDVLEYHDYHVDQDFPGDPDDGLQTRIDDARRLNKPLVVSEIGLEAGSCLPLAQRRDILERAIATQRGHGTAGALFWAFVPDPRQDQCTLDIGPDDPLMSLLGTATG